MTKAKLRGQLLRASKAMPPAMRREFRSFLGEIDERKQDLTAGDPRQPMLFDPRKIPRKVRAP